MKECNETSQKQVSLSLYKKTFSENHNLSFFKQKKNQCIINLQNLKPKHGYK